MELNYSALADAWIPAAAWLLPLALWMELSSRLSRQEPYAWRWYFKAAWLALILWLGLGEMLASAYISLTVHTVPLDGVTKEPSEYANAIPYLIAGLLLLFHGMGLQHLKARRLSKLAFFIAALEVGFASFLSVVTAIPKFRGGLIASNTDLGVMILLSLILVLGLGQFALLIKSCFKSPPLIDGPSIPLPAPSPLESSK